MLRGAGKRADGPACPRESALTGAICDPAELYGEVVAYGRPGRRPAPARRRRVKHRQRFTRTDRDIPVTLG
jgi:hypothetical protein